HAETTAELMTQRLQLALIRSWIERPIAQAHISTLLHGKADEAHAGIAVVIFFASSDGSRETLLAVKTVARGDDHLASRVACQGRPERFLDRLGAGSCPEHLLQAPASRTTLQEFDQTPAGINLDGRHRVVRRHREGGEEPVANGPASGLLL